MGGTSAGIAFVSEDHPPSNYSFAVDILVSLFLPLKISFILVVYINGTSFTIYAQSIDGMGINEARFSLNYSLILNSTSSIHSSPFLYLLLVDKIRHRYRSLCTYWILRKCNSRNQR